MLGTSELVKSAAAMAAGCARRATAGGLAAAADNPLLRVVVTSACSHACSFCDIELVKEGRVVGVYVAVPVDVGQESSVQRMVGVANDIAAIGRRQGRRKVADIVVVSNSITVDIPVAIVGDAVGVTVGLASVADSIAVAVSLVGIGQVAIVASIADAVAVRVTLVRIDAVESRIVAMMRGHVRIAIVALVSDAVAVVVGLVVVRTIFADAALYRIVGIAVVAGIGHVVGIVIGDAATPRAGGADRYPRFRNDADVKLVGIAEIVRGRVVVGHATSSGLTAFVVQPVAVRIPTAGSGACGCTTRTAAFRDILTAVR